MRYVLRQSTGDGGSLVKANSNTMVWVDCWTRGSYNKFESSFIAQTTDFYLDNLHTRQDILGPCKQRCSRDVVCPRCIITEIDISDDEQQSPGSSWHIKTHVRDVVLLTAKEEDTETEQNRTLQFSPGRPDPVLLLHIGCWKVVWTLLKGFCQVSPLKLNLTFMKWNWKLVCERELELQSTFT
jgi:hypothetical protein